MELSLTRKAPMRLKDYLVDELSSCSSNGFRSYPRRRQQCCTTTTTTIRLIDVQLHLKNPTLKTPSSKSSSISAFQRASNALINAVKLLHLPFASSGPASTLPRKFIKRCFSKKKTDNNNNNNVEIPIGINAVVDEKSSSPELSFTTGISSISTESNGESYSWSSGSDFTTSDHEYLQCSRVNYEVKKLNKKPKARSVKINGIVGDEDSVEATSDTSTSTSTSSSKPKPLQTEGEKEHFSPVSVLDRPFEDDEDEDEDEVSSPFQPRLARSKGSKKRLVKKTQKLEGITKVEPINLEICIALSESDDQESGSEKRIECKAKDKENNAERKAFELLQLMRGTIFPSSPMNVEEKLLLEFFREGIEIGLLRTPMGGVNGFDNELLLNTAVDWMKGQPQEQVLLQKSDVKKNMESCLRDIEKESDWRKWDEEKKELLFELEAEVFASLMNEVLHDDLWRK